MFLFPHSQEGTHVIVATEVYASVNGEGVGRSLNSGSFNVVISKGIPSKLNIDGSPVTVYSSSVGANMQATEVRQEFVVTSHDSFQGSFLQNKKNE